MKHSSSRSSSSRSRSSSAKRSQLYSQLQADELPRPWGRSHSRKVPYPKYVNANKTRKKKPTSAKPTHRPMKPRIRNVPTPSRKKHSSTSSSHGYSQYVDLDSK